MRADQKKSKFQVLSLFWSGEGKKKKEKTKEKKKRKEKRKKTPMVIGDLRAACLIHQ